MVSNCEEAEKVTEAKLEQPLKALSPMVVTELGIAIEVSFPQPMKALPAMVSTEFPRVTVVRLLQN